MKETVSIVVSLIGTFSTIVGLVMVYRRNIQHSATVTANFKHLENTVQEMKHHMDRQDAERVPLITDVAVLKANIMSINATVERIAKGA